MFLNEISQVFFSVNFPMYSLTIVVEGTVFKLDLCTKACEG